MFFTLLLHVFYIYVTFFLILLAGLAGSPPEEAHGRPPEEVHGRPHGRPHGKPGGAAGAREAGGPQRRPPEEAHGRPPEAAPQGICR